MTADEVIRALGTDAHAGLSSAAAAAKLARHGRNELVQAPPTPWWQRLAQQFGDLLIWILIAATTRVRRPRRRPRSCPPARPFYRRSGVVASAIVLYAAAP